MIGYKVGFRALSRCRFGIGITDPSPVCNVSCLYIVWQYSCETLLCSTCIFHKNRNHNTSSQSLIWSRLSQSVPRLHLIHRRPWSACITSLYRIC